MHPDQSPGQSISLQSVTKAWGDTKAVNEVDLEVAPGTFTVLLGPSGCGKSTSLRIIAGLEAADEGQVVIGGRDVTLLPPSKRDIAMVFQSYALFPHLNVAENILFGLKVRKTSKADQKRRLDTTADMLGLLPFLDRKPSQLSGGQQQRVALGRAIIAEKPICLMDEPLSNLDAKLRNSMRTEIRDLQQSLGFSMVYVTHDQSEAITMADQVVLMRDGRIEQSGTPREIYESPATTFVAGFIGTPPMNLIPATELADDFHLDGIGNRAEEFTIGVRPEHIGIHETRGYKAQVEHVEYLGADLLAECRLGDTVLNVRLEGATALSSGDLVTLNWRREQQHVFISTSGERFDSAGEVGNGAV